MTQQEETYDPLEFALQLEWKQSKKGGQYAAGEDILLIVKQNRRGNYYYAGFDKSPDALDGDMVFQWTHSFVSEEAAIAAVTEKYKEYITNKYNDDSSFNPFNDSDMPF